MQVLTYNKEFAYTLLDSISDLLKSEKIPFMPAIQLEGYFQVIIWL